MSTGRTTSSQGFGHSARLRAALNLQNNENLYCTLKAGMLKISEKNFNLKKTFKEQAAGKKAAIKDLKDTYPDIFLVDNGEHLLKLAMSFLGQRHSYLRYENGFACPRPNSRKPKENQADATHIYIKTQAKEDQSLPNPPKTDGQSNRLSKRTPLEERAPNNFGSSQPRPFLPRIISSSRNSNMSPLAHLYDSSGHFLSSETTEINYPIPPQYTQGASTDYASASQPSRRQTSGNRATCSHTSSASVSKCQLTGIHDFLQSCQPPMLHFMRRFFDFGCTTEEYLMTISTWSVAEIDEFLVGLPPAASGAPITPMEKLVLRRHFLTYFK